MPPKRCSSSNSGSTGSSSNTTHRHGVWPAGRQHIFFWEPYLASSAFDGKFLFPKSIISVIYVYSLPFISKQESQDEEELPEEGRRGGQTPGVGSQLSSQSGARPRGPRSASQGRRRQQRGGHQRPSQRAPDSDGEDGEIDVDHLIDLVRERELLWNMADRRHADLIITRRLWEEICSLLVDRWEDLDARAQIKERDRIVKRWRSVRDRFKKEFNKEMRAPSGSGGRRSKYKYAQALSFLRETMVTRSTVSSTREPARLDPSETIPKETGTEGHFDRPGTSAPSQPSHTFDPSVPSTSTGASWPPTLHEAAGEEIAFPLPHPSAPATSSTPAGTGRQRQRGQEKTYAPEFLHLNASFQNCLKVLSEQISAGFQQINSSILEVKTLLQTMHSEARSSPNHTFFRSVVERMETLSPTQQMHVMHSCHGALQHVTSQPPPPTTVVPVQMTTHFCYYMWGQMTPQETTWKPSAETLKT
ncbi:uncharacterized protein [Dendrobates tinctorius]|uniref:uncharacterized protein isoform X2 n=1 Tax=Dendrobates tinctorius TaxID=92724 RepID=UPI003CC9BA5A